ncbi:S8 family peptidase [Emydomyces testavorans]|uniref:S8 family peptidase n=1 Tax=Emydomyces testavorans TaxID=2070801 RepID=A0AAF0ILU4_9EURO|nr:S8 family peptidase [Emydomyces testavorans]
MQLLRSLLLLLPFVAANPIPRAEPEIIPGKYIVTFKDGVSQSDIDAHKTWVASVHQSYLAAAAGVQKSYSAGMRKTYQINKMNAYSGVFDDKTAADIRRNPIVAAVTPDQKVHLSSIVTQENATWGLGRMSGKGQNSTEYKYDSSAGHGVFVYVLDSGLNVNHVEFEGRAIFGHNAVDESPNEDLDGHGTHVAGIINSKTYGVAKRATVVGVKGFDGYSSSYESVLDAYDWIVDDIRRKHRKNKAVVTLSFSGAPYEAFDNAVRQGFAAGITHVAAAGNSYNTTADTTPGGISEIITVGALQQDNTRAPFSNYGQGVDIFAPGDDILSLYKGSNEAIIENSGTSAACAHVAGLIAYLMGKERLTSPTAVARRVFELSVPDLVKDARGSANRIAYNGIREQK